MYEARRFFYTRIRCDDDKWIQVFVAIFVVHCFYKELDLYNKTMVQPSYDVLMINMNEKLTHMQSVGCI